MILFSNCNNKIFNEISNFHLINQHFSEEKLVKLKEKIENEDIANLNNAKDDSYGISKTIEDGFHIDDFVSKRLHEYFENFE